MKLCEIVIPVFAVVLFCGSSAELMRWGADIIVVCCFVAPLQRQRYEYV